MSDGEPLWDDGTRQGRDVDIAAEVVHAKQDDVVVSGGDLLDQPAIQPRARAIEEHGALLGDAPVQRGEAVDATTTQLAAGLLLVDAEHADSITVGRP